jgi:hypothetical protein
LQDAANKIKRFEHEASARTRTISWNLAPKRAPARARQPVAVMRVEAWLSHRRNAGFGDYSPTTAPERTDRARMRRRSADPAAKR